MITPGYCALMARYAQWMNTRLHAALTNLDDEARKRPRGAFFGSIHETCNHLLWGDRIWFSRFTGTPFSIGQFGRGMYADFDVLRSERAATDSAVQHWADTLASDWLAGTLRYTSAVDGKERVLPTAVAAMHFFNHGTHHRGQLTALMFQAGIDPGVTDLPWVLSDATTR